MPDISPGSTTPGDPPHHPPNPGGMPETVCTRPSPNPSAIPAGIVDIRPDPSPGVPGSSTRANIWHLSEVLHHPAPRTAIPGHRPRANIRHPSKARPAHPPHPGGMPDISPGSTTPGDPPPPAPASRRDTRNRMHPADSQPFPGTRPSAGRDGPGSDRKNHSTPPTGIFARTPPSQKTQPAPLSTFSPKKIRKFFLRPPGRLIIPCLTQHDFLAPVTQNFTTSLKFAVSNHKPITTIQPI